MAKIASDGALWDSILQDVSEGRRAQPSQLFVLGERDVPGKFVGILQDSVDTALEGQIGKSPITMVLTMHPMK